MILFRNDDDLTIMRYLICLFFLLIYFSTFIYAQQDTVVLLSANEQKTFPESIPAGNYSGICHLEENRYVVVSDKSPQDGFFVFAIDIDSVSGDILKVQNLGFKSADADNRDGEGIAYLPNAKTVLMSGEADGKILEYDLDGHRTIRAAAIPAIYGNSTQNQGFESLSYSSVTHRLWTCNESTLRGDGEQATSTNIVENHIRIQSFDDALQPLQQYAYKMDAPMSKKQAEIYAMGIPELTALGNGSLLVLEREFYVPSLKLGAYVNCKLYQAWPSTEIDKEQPLTENSSYMKKHLVCQWRTSLSLFNHAVANYEGMCLGPKLKDGSQTLLLVSDSQNQYAGVLKDWFKTLIIKQ